MIATFHQEYVNCEETDKTFTNKGGMYRFFGILDTNTEIFLKHIKKTNETQGKNEIKKSRVGQFLNVTNVWLHKVNASSRYCDVCFSKLNI